MDSYVKAITLDVNADENYTIIKAKQGDKINRKIAITLKKDGANFTPTGVSQIWFRVQKPDKNIAIVKSTDSGNPISSAGNVYTVTLSEQCLTASGKAWCDLAFLDSSGNTLSSCAFILNIIPMPNGNTARSISEWSDLQQAIDDAERFASIVAFRTSGNYIQYTVDGTTWVNLTTVGAIGGDLQTQINTLSGYLERKNMTSVASADSEIVSGFLQHYWEFGHEPSLAYDYSPVIFLKPSSQESTVLLFARGSGNLLTRHKIDGVWEEWVYHDTREAISLNTENGSTASRNYAKGEFLFRNGLLYMAKVAISQGDSLSGSNLLSARICERIQSLEQYSEKYGASFAYVDNSNTASRAYTKGDFVIRSGTLYVVTANISSGASFTSSNITAVSVGSRLTALEKISQQEISGQYVKAVRVGAIVNFTGATGSWTVDSDGYLSVGGTPIQLNEDFRPFSNIEIVDALNLKRITVLTNGRMSSNITSATNLRFSGCWIAGNAI